MAVIGKVHARFCTLRAIRSGLLHRLLGRTQKESLVHGDYVQLLPVNSCSSRR